MLELVICMSNYKLVVCDVDGTLIPPASYQATGPSESVIKTASKVQQKGVIVSIATARSLERVEDLVKILNIQAPIILDNGARIYHCGEKRYLTELFLPEEIARSIITRLSTFHDKVVFVDQKGRHEYKPDKYLSLKNVVKIIILHVTPEKAEAIYKNFKNTPDILVAKSISGHNPTAESVHITSAASGKDIALLEIARFLNLNTKEIIGIGDSYNDLDFLKVCGLKVAMGNSVEEVKKIADYIAPSYEHDGVADVLEKFILNEESPPSR